MKQLFALATLVTLTLAGPAAYALGFGQPAVHSYLHAPLNVSIPLVDADQYAPEELGVSVAGRSAFQAVGLDWNTLVASVKAEIHAGSGTPEVRLTSSVPATAPWFDLLLTLSSPDGAITRNVTLLFDPSARADQNAAAGAVDPSGAKAVVRGSDAAASSARVKNGDTLWRVAERLKPESASIEQVMLALVAANPGAFPSGNINDLNAGSELHVPTAATILSRGKAQAAQTIDYMNTAWRIRGPGGPVHVPLGPTDAAVREVAHSADEPVKPASTPRSALNSSALNAAKALQNTEANTAGQNKATLERITRQRDQLREEVSQLKAELSQLTNELALQEVELARQEMRGTTPLPEVSSGTQAKTDASGPESQAKNTAVAPPAGELAIAWRGMVAMVTEYRWPLAGGVLLLLLLLVWQFRRRPLSTGLDEQHDAREDQADAMLDSSQAAGLASSRRVAPRDAEDEEACGAEEVAFESSSQDNARSSH